MPDDLTPDPKQPESPLPENLYEGQPSVSDPKEQESPFQPSKELELSEVPQEGVTPLESHPRNGERGLAKASERALTNKAAAFLELLIAGWEVYKAYKAVGYRGNLHAAIQMKSDLRFHLTRLLEQHGVSKDDLKIQVLQMLKIPLVQPVINVDEKIKLVKAMAKLMDEDLVNVKPKITPFIMNIESASGVTIKEGDKKP